METPALSITQNLHLQLSPKDIDALASIIREVSAQPVTGSLAVTLDAPLPGQFWREQGGTCAGIMRGDDSTLYHLIVGSDSMDIEGKQWGSYGQTEEGAQSCWDGLANTRALVESKHDHPAAQAIHQLNVGDPHGDWYLPAQAELSLCRAAVRHLFKTDDWYWSSTQFSASNAWYQSFSYGSQDIYDKDHTGRVRAVRRLIIQ